MFHVLWKSSQDMRFCFTADVMADDPKEAILVFASMYPRDIILGVKCPKTGRFLA